MSAARIAVLGATGHVGSVLVAGLAASGREVAAFARSQARLERLLGGLPNGDAVEARALDSFGSERFDAVVNAIGMGDPPKSVPDARELRALTEHFDAEVLTYLRTHPSSRAVGISSGAAYMSSFDAPAGPDTPLRRPTDPADGPDAYGAVKAESEARHRAADAAAIVDLRLFGLFSRSVDPGAGFLLSQVVRCLRTGETLHTDAVDVIRDYAHPDDLTALVNAVIDAPPVNQPYDVYSLAPAAKSAILAALRERFGLSYTVGPEAHVSGSGRKPCYFSTDRAAASLGYEPRFSTLECVIDVATRMVEQWEDAAR